MMRTDIEGGIDTLLRLRRLVADSDDRMRVELAPVFHFVESVVGRTVARSTAARLLRVSQTALDRWVAAGEVPAVITPTGRRVVPVRHLIDLLEAVDLERERGRRRPLAHVIHRRRAAAEALDVARLLPPAEPTIHGHRSAELQGLAYHRVVAERLDTRMLDDARERLRGWRSGGAIAPGWASRWAALLDRPIAEVAHVISADTEEARDLRQSSPFVGVLTEQERRHVLQTVGARRNLAA